MSRSSIKDKMNDSWQTLCQETADYIESIDFGKPEESDAPDSHKQTCLNDIEMKREAEEAGVQSESRTSCNDTFSNATDADPDHEQGSEADKACSMTETTERPTTNNTNDFLLVDEGRGPKLVQQSLAAAILCKRIRSKYRYDWKALTWHEWTDSCYWKQCESVEVDAAVTEMIQQGAGAIGFNISYTKGVFEILRKLRSIRLPKHKRDKIPFQNGLLDISTMRLHPINQENATTWVLPYDYTKSSDCPQFLFWLSKAVDGDEETVQLLRAFINAVLVGRPELQKFLHIIGPAGTGKSTFGRILFRIVGDENATTTTLRQLQGNQFEAAHIYGKRLVAIEEADKYGGSVSFLKSMTGQDPLRLERKHQQQSGSYIFWGQVFMMSNERFVTSDHTSGIERRRMTVWFLRRFSIEERASWQERGGEEEILYPEIPGIINWALELNDMEVRTLFNKTPERVRQANLDAARDNNPVLDWMLESLIPETNSSVQIGNNEREHGGGESKFKHAETRLYPHYCTWCHRNAKQTWSLQKFGAVMIEQAATYGVALKHDRKKDGTKIFGIRLRQVSEPSWLDSV